MDAKQISRHIKIWWLQTAYTMQISLASRFSAGIFIVSKILRFILFFVFLAVLESQTKIIGGYSLWQIIIFFLTFSLVDNIAQFLFREVYRFRWYIIDGSFDYILLKPYPPLTRSLLGGADALDIPLIVITIGFLIFAATKVVITSPIDIFFFTALIINAILIALAFHIAVLALGILTTAVDNAIMLYRDLTQMGRIPVTIYREPLRGILTFIIPVGIMMTVPAQALMGLISWQGILVSLILGILAVYISIWFWKKALKEYSSASS